VLEILHKSCWALANIFVDGALASQYTSVSLLGLLCDFIDKVPQVVQGARAREITCEALFALGNLITETDQCILTHVLTAE